MSIWSELRSRWFGSETSFSIRPGASAAEIRATYLQAGEAHVYVPNTMIAAVAAALKPLPMIPSWDDQHGPHIVLRRKVVMSMPIEWQADMRRLVDEMEAKCELHGVELLQPMVSVWKPGTGRRQFMKDPLANEDGANVFIRPANLNADQGAAE